jgi:hypothetical protein
MTINTVRTALYTAARLLGDVNAVRKGKIGQRLVNKIIGRVFGRLYRRK